MSDSSSASPQSSRASSPAPLHPAEPTQNIGTAKTSGLSILRPWRLLKRLLTSFGRFQVGPFTIALAAATAALIQRLHSEQTTPQPAPEDVSKVSGFYGPGTYYAWLINAVAAVCQSNPSPKPKLKKDQEPGGKVETDTVTKDLNMAHHMSIVISTLGVVIYAACAAVDELIRDTHGEAFSASRDAADRVCQVGWILSTLYLLHHFFNGCWIGDFKVPSLTTSIWMMLWTLITIAMSVDNVVRGSLGSTAVKVFVPFAIGIPIPILAFCLMKQPDLVQWQKDHTGWEIAALNVGTFTLSTIYMFTPSTWRYDHNSPAAPLSASNLSDLDQAVALAIGTFVAIPVLFLLWERGRQWFKPWAKVLLSPSDDNDRVGT